MEENSSESFLKQAWRWKQHKRSPQYLPYIWNFGGFHDNTWITCNLLSTQLQSQIKERRCIFIGFQLFGGHKLEDFLISSEHRGAAVPFLKLHQLFFPTMQRIPPVPYFQEPISYCLPPHQCHSQHQSPLAMNSEPISAAASAIMLR